MCGSLGVFVGTKVKDVGSQKQYFAARAQISGSPSETTLSVGSYTVMDIDLDEKRDVGDCFTLTSAQNGNEVCYKCASTIVTQINAVLSFERSTGAATDVITLAFGSDTTGAIGNGDEKGDEFMRSVATTSVAGMGTLSWSKQWPTDSCVSIMGKVDDDTGGAGWTMKAVALSIIEP
jgi:hypothetical protein